MRDASLIASKSTSVEVFIPHPEEFYQKIQALQADGTRHLSVISDFDQTLSKYRACGEVEYSTFNVLEDFPLFTSEFKDYMKTLFDRYFPLEYDSRLSLSSRIQHMQTWWSLTFEKYLQLGITKSHLQGLIDHSKVQLRHGISELMSLCRDLEVPVTVVSAGLGDLINLCLRVIGFDRTHIVSNFMVFDTEGHLTGFAEPLIHSLNKSIALQGQITPNAVVLGDRPKDMEVIQDLNLRIPLKIGFFNGCPRLNRADFESSYDLLVLNDGDLDVVVNIIEVISGRKSIPEFQAYLSHLP